MSAKLRIGVFADSPLRPRWAESLRRRHARRASLKLHCDSANGFLRFSADRVVAQLEQIYARLGLARSAGARACMPARPLRGAA